MVHRSGSTNQYVELNDNEESTEPNAKSDKKSVDPAPPASASVPSTTSASVPPPQKNLIAPETNVVASTEISPAAACDAFVAAPTTTASTPPPVEAKRGTRTSQRLKSVCLDTVCGPPPPLPAIKDKSSANQRTILGPPNGGVSSSSSIIAPTTTNVFDRKSIRARRNTITDCIQTLHAMRNERLNAVQFASKCNDKTRTKNEAATSRPSGGGSKSDTEDNVDQSKPLLSDKLNCSVSLERLSGIIDNLLVAKSGNNDDNDEAAASANKTLCLYCDRSFSSQKLHSKHVERIHHSPSGRRLSARNTAAIASNIYIGCSYCNVGKITCLPVDDLLPLLHHLVEVHNDKYFACEDCMLRFANEDALMAHDDDFHNGRERARKSRNVFSKRRIKDLSKSDRDLRSITTPLEVQVDFNNDLTVTADDSQSSEEPSMRRRLRRNKILHGSETILSRLGLAQNRSPRTMKGAKNRRGADSTAEPYRSETPSSSSSRSTRSNKNARTATVTANNVETADFASNKSVVNGKPETIVSTFDEDFYESVTGNVKKNLSCHLDGKLESGPMSPSPMSPVEAVPAVRSILVRSPIVSDSEIHEATTISAVTAFPTLLTEQQYGVDPCITGKMKKPITRHSWKWRWDCVKKYKYVNEGGKIVKKVKQPIAGIRDLSKLDMWTQLTMRSKHEAAFREDNNLTGDEAHSAVGEVAREEKRRTIDQLNEILDTRVLPQISSEQNDQSIIKLERMDDGSASSSAALIAAGRSAADLNFPTNLNLIKLERAIQKPNIVLSGEWARPRCYICFGCGGKFETVRSLEEHKVNKHPHVYSTHYEIVGKELIDGNLLQNFYIPKNALHCHEQYNKRLTFANMADDSMDSETSYTTISLQKSESIDMDSNSRNSKVSVSSASVASTVSRSSTVSSSEDVNKKRCTKCDRGYNGFVELYRHMLDCSSDYYWLLAKKRQNIKYRYFGTKRRRVHRPNKGCMRKVPRPKKEDTSDGSSPKSKDPPTPRTRPSDAESIQRMLANLPAKRAARQIFPELTQKSKKKINPSLARKQLLVKQKTIGNRAFKFVSTNTTINSVANNIALRKKRNVEGIRLIKSEVVVARRTRSSLNASETVTGDEKPSSRASPDKTTKRDSRKGEPLSKALRRHTKTVVAKISNTFRRGNAKRLLSTSSTAKPAPNANADANKGDNTKSITKTSFLRTLSYRRSKRNTRNVDTTKPETLQANEASSKNIDTKDAASKIEEESENVQLEKQIEQPAEKSAEKSIENLPTSSVDETIEKPLEKSTEKPTENQPFVDVADDIHKAKNVDESPIATEKSIPTMQGTLDTPTQSAEKSEINSSSKPPTVLKRKKSLKSIINNIRNKCEQQHLSDTPEVVIPSVEIDQPVDLTITPAPTNAPVIEIVNPSEKRPIDESMQLSIDEPINLSLKRRESPPGLSLTAAISPPLQLLSPSLLSSGASSPLSPLSPTSSTPSKKRTKKLNDCIAMLTGKLQEKLGVPFLEPSTSALTTPAAVADAHTHSVTSVVSTAPQLSPAPASVSITIPTVLDAKKPVTILSIPDLTARKEALEKKIAKDSTTKALRECRKESARKTKTLAKTMEHKNAPATEQKSIAKNDLIVPMVPSLPAIPIAAPIEKNTPIPHTPVTPALTIPNDIRTKKEMVANKPADKTNYELFVEIVEAPQPSQSLLQIVTSHAISQNSKSPATEPITAMTTEKNSLAAEEKVAVLPEVKPASPARTSSRNSARKLVENSLKDSQPETPTTLHPLEDPKETANKPHDDTKSLNELSESDKTKLPPPSVETESIVNKSVDTPNPAIVNTDSKGVLDILEDFEMNIASSVIEKQAFIKEADERQKVTKETDKQDEPVNKRAAQRKKRTASNIRKKESKGEEKQPDEKATDALMLSECSVKGTPSDKIVDEPPQEIENSNNLSVDEPNINDNIIDLEASAKKNDRKSTKSRAAKKTAKSTEMAEIAVVPPAAIDEVVPIVIKDTSKSTLTKKSPRKSKKAEPEQPQAAPASIEKFEPAAPVDEKVDEAKKNADISESPEKTEASLMELQTPVKSSKASKATPKSKSKKASTSRSAVVESETEMTPITPVKGSKSIMEAEHKEEKPSKSTTNSKNISSKKSKSAEPSVTDDTRISSEVEANKVDAEEKLTRATAKAKSKEKNSKAKSEEDSGDVVGKTVDTVTDPVVHEKEPEVTASTPLLPSATKSKASPKAKGKQQSNVVSDVTAIPMVDVKDNSTDVENRTSVTPKPKSRTAQRKSKTPASEEKEIKTATKDAKKAGKSIVTEPTEQTPTQSKRKSTKSLSEKKSSKRQVEKMAEVEHDVSDDELLPWDPEIGFVKKDAEIDKKIDAEDASISVDREDLEIITADINSSASDMAIEDRRNVDAATPTPKAKKKRRNELAQIIADQLLESFKEVDAVHLNELKKINDLTNCEDFLAASFSATSIPKRRAKQLAIETATNVKSCAEEQPHVNEEKPIKKSAKSTTSRSKFSTTENKSEADKIILEEPFEPAEETIVVSKAEKNTKKDSSKRKKPNESKESVNEKAIAAPAAPDVSPTKTTPKNKTIPVNSLKGKKAALRNDKTSPIVFDEKKNQEIAPAAREKDDNKNIFLGDFDKSPLKETRSQMSENVKPTKASDAIVSCILPKKTIDTDFCASKSTKSVESPLNMPVPDVVAQILDDFTSSTVESKSSSSNMFVESIFTTAARTNSLSDLFTKSASSTSSPTSGNDASILPPKNKLVDNLITFDKINNRNSANRPPFMSAHWEAADEKGESKPSLVTESKVNFWSRNKDEPTTEKKSIFGLVKSKTKNILDKISKRKLKRSLKTSISCSSSSSSSSSCPSPSHLAAKKPILRPSILSCKNFGEKTETDATDCGASDRAIDANSTKNVDVFDALKMSAELVEKPIAKVASKPVLAEPVLSRKMGSMRRRTGKLVKDAVVVVDGPKSPIESDMNIAKIAIALNSNREEKLKQEEGAIEKLNEAFRVADKTRASVRHGRHKKSKADKSNASKQRTGQTKEQALTSPSAHTNASSAATSNILNDDSSQDTIISQIISKIRENADRSEDSDDDLCLTDVTKARKSTGSANEFEDTSTIELSQSRMEKNFSALVSDINKRLESPTPGHLSDDSRTPLDSGLADGDEDENTNTEPVDMDLEDDVSVYTGISIDTSITSGGTGSENRKKKRKKKSIISKTRKAKRTDNGFVSPSVAIHHCDICNKSFRKPSALNSHKMTISHISKLSEQEFLDAKKKEKDMTADAPDVKEDLKQIVDDDVKLENKENLDIIAEKPVLQKSPVQISLPQKSPPLEPHAPGLNLFPSPNHQNTYGNQNSSFEPISPTEQSPRLNTTPKHTSAANAANSRLALSQEERLFYECCSMLKGSERSNPAHTKADQTSKPVTPKSNEQASTNIAHSAQSPRSHPSPRPGIPKLDLDNFSDISSDSNPAYSCPHVPSSSKTQKASELIGASAQTTSSGTPLINFFKKSTNNEIEIRRVNNTTYPNSSMIVRNYPDTYSDMGDSFPSSQDASESEHYAQTILERSSNVLNVASMQSAISPKYEQSAFEAGQLHSSFSNRSHMDSPMHSTSSQCSSIGRPRTKAAMKGYENLKVSIPTTGLDLQQALDRSPNSNGCKLSALAEIALGTDAPIVGEMLRSKYLSPLAGDEKPASTCPASIIVKVETPGKMENLTVSIDHPAGSGSGSSTQASPAKAAELSPKKQLVKLAANKVIGNKLPSKERRKKQPPAMRRNTTSNRKSGKSAAVIKNLTNDLPKDIYDFEESVDSAESTIKPLTHVRTNKDEPKKPDSPADKTPKTTVDDAEGESTYSDRDGYFNYNSVDNSESEEDDESDAGSVMTKKSIKTPVPVQKKCLIMGRIFKNAKKDTDPPKSPKSPKAEKKREVIKSMVKKQMNDIFDDLRGRKNKEQKDAIEPKKAAVNVDDHKYVEAGGSSGTTRSRKSREIISLEAEWGMSIEEIKDLIGVGKRKTQRRCAANRPKNVETWSSDEYEEFHSTKDIITMIQEAEKRAERTKNKAAKNLAVASEEAKTGSSHAEDMKNVAVVETKPPVEITKPAKKPTESIKKATEPAKKATEPTKEAKKTKPKPETKKVTVFSGDSDFESDWNRTAKRATIKNRRRTIAFREEAYEEKKKDVAPPKTRANKRGTMLEASPLKKRVPSVPKSEKTGTAVAPMPATVVNKPTTSATRMKDGKPMPRRKRVASEMLYYWSSSSDEEFGRIESNENDYEGDDDNNLEQHGWIVGDSHKKLVTLLAHAKGKKVDDCAVKEAVHRKK